MAAAPTNVPTSSIPPPLSLEPSGPPRKPPRLPPPPPYVSNQAGPPQDRSFPSGHATAQAWPTRQFDVRPVTVTTTIPTATLGPSATSVAPGGGQLFASKVPSGSYSGVPQYSHPQPPPPTGGPTYTRLGSPSNTYSVNSTQGTGGPAYHRLPLQTGIPRQTSPVLQGPTSTSYYHTQHQQPPHHQQQQQPYRPARGPGRPRGSRKSFHPPGGRFPGGRPRLNFSLVRFPNPALARPISNQCAGAQTSANSVQGPGPLPSIAHFSQSQRQEDILSPPTPAFIDTDFNKDLFAEAEQQLAEMQTSQSPLPVRNYFIYVQGAHPTILLIFSFVRPFTLSAMSTKTVLQRLFF